MPYQECPACGLRLYSAAVWSSRDRCARCDAALVAPDRPALGVRDAPRALSRRLVADARAPQAARRALEAFDGQLDREALQTSGLLVSELVTNSVNHALSANGATVDLRAAVTPHRLRVEVLDAGEGIETVASAPDDDHEWHWGLHLVESLADSWGAERWPRALVWFELSLSPP